MKVLLISHNCFLTCSNMGKTFCALFSQFSKEELCQIYIHPALPDVDACHSCYRVTDKEVLKSFFTFRKPGAPLDMAALSFWEPREFENEKDVRLYRRSGNSSPAAMLLRDTMWKLSRWYTPALRRWVEQEAPSCIVLAPGYAKFIYDIAFRISRDYGLPIVTYLCDDYYFVDPPAAALGRFYLKLLRRKMDVLFSKTSHIVGISPELCQRYQDHFGIPAQVHMTGAQLSPVDRQPHSGDLVFSYMGSLRPFRQEPLAQLGQALDAWNRRNGTAHRLRIYTSERERVLLEPLRQVPAIELCGFVTGQALTQAYREADFLIHAESFRKETADLTKYSLSTKIADCLASGIPLLAYGPANIASIAHLQRNDCAFVATDPSQLDEVICSAIQDEDRRRNVLANAAQTAERFHDVRKNSRQLHRLLEKVEKR